jgi:hypothetical protein
MAKLNTSNPECLQWNHEQVRSSILGGIRIEGLDRMKVTLKIEYKEHVIRHNLDLYNDASMDRLVKRCAERFSLGTAYVSDVFTVLVNDLEAYRLEEMKKGTAVITRVPISADRARQVMAFLKAPDLLARTNELIGQSGVVGEEVNRFIMYLVFTSRKREQPLHVISLGSSGTGKSHLQEKVGELIPEEDKIEITTLSENAFYYFGQQELKHKLILIEDLDGAQEVLYPLRELQSKRVITKSIAYKNSAGQTQTQHLRVEGPVSVAGCTTRESVYEDNANRSFLLYLDESKEQDNRIMDYQRKRSAGRINVQVEHEAKTFLQDVQRLLQPIGVRNPFAEQLVLPAQVFKARRTNAHYLAFIEVITFYHQHQREVKTDANTVERYIETTLDDIKQANNLLKEILLRKSDDLPGGCRDYLERVKALRSVMYTNKEISKALHIPISTVKRHNLALLQTGYLHRELSKDGSLFRYSLLDEESYQQLQSTISNTLDQVLEQLTGSVLAQQASGPIKRKRSKTKS